MAARVDLVPLPPFDRSTLENMETSIRDISSRSERNRGQAEEGIVAL